MRLLGLVSPNCTKNSLNSDCNRMNEIAEGFPSRIRGAVVSNVWTLTYWVSPS
jgi:hypothetical protein